MWAATAVMFSLSEEKWVSVLNKVVMGGRRTCGTGNLSSVLVASAHLMFGMNLLLIPVQQHHHNSGLHFPTGFSAQSTN